MPQNVAVKIKGGGLLQHALRIPGVRRGAAAAQARRVALARSLATEASAWVSPLPAVDAELFLAAVSVLRRERYARALDIERRRLDALAPALDGLPRGFPERG